MHRIVLKDVKRITSRVDCSSLEGKRILITGGTGLIGSYFLNLFSFLIENKHMSLTVDSISKTDASVETRLNSPNINFMKYDLGSNFDLPIDTNYDLIIHGAGYGQPKKFLADEISTMTLNGMATLKLTKSLKEGGTFLFLSTSEIYLGSLSLPNKESDVGGVSSDHPRAPYVIGKNYGETLMASLNRAGIDTKIARIALAYGPGTKQDDDRVLNQLVKRGILEGSIRLLDQGQAVRTYCYVADTLEMLLQIILFGKSMTYNVGGTSRISIKGLAELLGEILGVGVIETETQSFLESAPQEVALDLGKYINEFGSPDFEDLKVGLRKTIIWQQENLYYEGEK